MWQFFALPQNVPTFRQIAATDPIQAAEAPSHACPMASLGLAWPSRGWQARQTHHRLKLRARGAEWLPRTCPRHVP